VKRFLYEDIDSYC